MTINKTEISQLVDSLGNEPKPKSSTPNFIEWMNDNNPLSDNQPTTPKKKNCKSGNCGNNKRTFILVGVILLVVMWAGYGLFTFIENLITK
jgi:hypothetical protein